MPFVPGKKGPNLPGLSQGCQVLPCFEGSVGKPPWGRLGEEPWEQGGEERVCSEGSLPLGWGLPARVVCTAPSV